MGQKLIRKLFTAVNRYSEKWVILTLANTKNLTSFETQLLLDKEIADSRPFCGSKESSTHCGLRMSHMQVDQILEIKKRS